ncbi:MAG: NUDIX hydrolase [Scytolyngbya sp. HA4215-MV1]|jgi:phosphatase NudJ|nr:NUDIX hydrolase [Scytolyngbya sp. HA4215-MV1]
MPREPIPMWCFAVAVVRKGDRFLLIQERKHGQQWYLPSGSVELGETFASAALRETLEEAGIPVRLVGIIRVEHSPRATSARLRVVFLAEPVDDTPPKSEPDEESLKAEWVRLDELDRYTLRGEGVRELFAYVAAGGAIFPQSILRPEGSPYRAQSMEL